MDLSSEIKRKIFHHLSLLYLLLYACFPSWIAVWILFLALIAVSATEFIRLRRPEINAWFLNKFSGIHRSSEVLAPSGIFWTLLGSWLAMVIFEEKRIVLSILGMLVFGDTAAALAGRLWGKRHWIAKPRPDDFKPSKWKFWQMPPSPEKTFEGSGGFAAASLLWMSLFLRPHVALLGALAGAWVESRQTKWNDNFWIPIGGGVFLSILSLLLHGTSGAALRTWQKIGMGVYIVVALGFMIYIGRKQNEEL